MNEDVSGCAHDFVSRARVMQTECTVCLKRELEETRDEVADLERTAGFTRDLLDDIATDRDEYRKRAEAAEAALLIINGAENAVNRIVRAREVLTEALT